MNKYKKKIYKLESYRKKFKTSYTPEEVKKERKVILRSIKNVVSDPTKDFVTLNPVTGDKFEDHENFFITLEKTLIKDTSKGGVKYRLKIPVKPEHFSAKNDLRWRTGLGCATKHLFSDASEPHKQGVCNLVSKNTKGDSGERHFFDTKIFDGSNSLIDDLCSNNYIRSGKGYRGAFNVAKVDQVPTDCKSNLTDFEYLTEVRKDAEQYFCVGIDSEYLSPSCKLEGKAWRKILCYQFYCISGHYEYKLMFWSVCGYRLSLEYCLGYLLEYLGCVGYRTQDVFRVYTDPLDSSKYIDFDSSKKAYEYYFGKTVEDINGVSYPETIIGEDTLQNVDGSPKEYSQKIRATRDVVAFMSGDGLDFDTRLQNDFSFWWDNYHHSNEAFEYLFEQASDIADKSEELQYFDRDGTPRFIRADHVLRAMDPHYRYSWIIPSDEYNNNCGMNVVSASDYVFQSVVPFVTVRASKQQKIKVCLIAHNAIADLSAFVLDSGEFRTIKNRAYSKNSYGQVTRRPHWFDKLHTIGGGLVTMSEMHTDGIILDCNYTDENRHVIHYPVRLEVRDTMIQAPEGAKSLRALGDSIGVPKLDVGAYIACMDVLRSENPRLFYDYAMNDSVIVVKYMGSLYGFNRLGCPTITTLSGKIAHSMICDYFNISRKDKEAFHRLFAGNELRKITKFSRKGNKSIKHDVREWEPFSHDNKKIQDMCSDAYKGGLNQCYEVCYRETKTWDYDIQNCYPVGMYFTPDIDWEHPIKREVHNEWADPKDFTDVMPLFVGYVEYEFPSNTFAPAIAEKHMKCLITLLEGSDTVTGIEIKAALHMGARIYIKEGYFLNPLTDDQGNVSYSLRNVVSELIRIRREFQSKYEKKGFEQLVVKIIVNAIYGKQAQAVVPKNVFNAMTDDTEQLPPSEISDPYRACMITAFIRSFLSVLMTEIVLSGYDVDSATTDGLISNIPPDLLRGLPINMLGSSYKDIVSEARKELTGDPEIFEVKHMNNDLLNFRTRGNISSTENVDIDGNPVEKGLNGVDAKNGFHWQEKFHAEDDGHSNRKIRMDIIATRTGRISEIRSNVLPGYRDMLENPSLDYVPRLEVKKISFDHDGKRDIDVNSLRTVTYTDRNGNEWDFVCYKTKPFKNLEEFEKYKKKLNDKVFPCLRSPKDFDLYRLVVSGNRYSTGNVDLDRARLFTQAYYLGLLPVNFKSKVKQKELSNVLTQTFNVVVSVDDIKNWKRKDRLKGLVIDVDPLLVYVDDFKTICKNNNIVIE